ncbi:MAG TPA: GntR family transcriptional regulator [Candidatus Fimousia stercorigallinarum]|nr:GntR family transcriptional regulator [Candidatus Fimousia stercorigallinarum]
MRWKITDDRPIWIQLKEQIIKMILSGQYQSGEKLPSVRDMAKDAGVNPNTMQRALASLDQEGLITTNRTIGRCITENEEIISSYRKTMAEKLIQNYLDNMKELGYTESEAFQFLYER